MSFGAELSNYLKAKSEPNSQVPLALNPNGLCVSNPVEEFTELEIGARKVRRFAVGQLEPVQFAVTHGSLSVSNGLFAMRLPGPPGTNVVVDRAFNLTTWTQVPTAFYLSN